ncbi:MCE family protein [Gordonia jinghuaiqii]|uniref:MCE family protein n=1 Tax=Gordonia jinghuaiqii TaxID=2758710 RepID=A0A7D7LXG2_9ACTN|nr:MlaD family protein [Gordonia jinghuaiqii]MCR5978393.1 MCE family protein [Gordonia jinghuaiqii]QMT02735.1 MCE family protein [Gordonia jinghuaiqii]
MSRHTTQDFIRGDLGRQLRTLTLVGVSTIAVLALVVGITSMVYSRTSAPDGTQLRVVVPALGPGIKPGSKVLLNGAEIGQVTEVATPGAGTVNLDLDLDPSMNSVLTDSLDLDFRPENYFGITAVNIVPRDGGLPLRTGTVLHRDSSPDFTMSTMLEQGSLVVDGTLTRDVIASLDKVMRYATGLAPLIRSGVIVADTVARTQRHMPTVLMRRANALLEEFPTFTRSVFDSLYVMTESPYNMLPDGSRGVPEQFHDLTNAGLTLASSDLFGLAGSLLASHGSELTPLTTSVKYLTDPLPQAIGGVASMEKLMDAIDGLDSAFTGSRQQKVLQLRVVLGGLPAMSSSLARMGLSPNSPGGEN